MKSFLSSAETHIPTLKSLAGNVGSFLRRLLREFSKDQCIIRASGLAFSSLLALVPLSAFVFSLFTGFGALDEFRNAFKDFIFTQLMPAMREEILGYFDGFIQNSRALGVAGLALFALTSIVLFAAINAAFNAVWGSRSRHNFLRQFTTYASVIVFGSLFISASFTLKNSFEGFMRRFGVEEGLESIGWVFRGLLRVSPSLFMFLFLLLLIMAIPSARVRRRSAVVGAIAGAVLWEIAKFVFFGATNFALRMSVIYGSIAAIPIFLIWLQISWLIILTSLEITYVHQYRDSIGIDGQNGRSFPFDTALTGFGIYYYVSERFIKGESPVGAHEICSALNVSPATVRNCTLLLEEHGLLLAAGEAHTDFVPAKALSAVTIGEVLAVIMTGGFSYSEKAGTIPVGAFRVVTQVFRTGLDAAGTGSMEDAIGTTPPPSPLSP